MENKKTPLLKLSLTICILTSLFNINSSAQERILTLDAAVNIALKKNRDISIAVLNVQKAGAAVDEAFGYALPSLDLSGSFSHFLKKPKMLFPDFEALLTNAS